MYKLLAAVALVLLCGCKSDTKKEKPASLQSEPAIYKVKMKNPRFEREDSYEYDSYVPKTSTGFYNPFARRLF